MRRYLPLVLLVVLCMPMVAQKRGPVTLYTLEECIRIALEKNLDVRLANARARASAAGLTAAFGSYLPSAEINAGYQRQLTNLQSQFVFVNGTLIEGEPQPNSYQLSAGINWLLFDGFRREANYDEARLGVDVSDRDLRTARLNVVSTVSRQYFAVLQAQQIVKTRREAADLSKATLARVVAQYDAGRSPITAKYSQETELANMEVSILQAQMDVVRTKSQLLSTIGEDASIDAEFAESSVASSVTTAEIDLYRQRIGTEEQALVRAFDVRPDLRSADLRVKSTEASIRAARSAYYPRLSGTVAYAWNNVEVRDFDTRGRIYAGLNLNIPLFDQFRTNLAIENQILNRTQALVDVERLKQQLRRDMRTAYVQLEYAERGTEIAQYALKTAQINAEATQERFNVGSATLLDVQAANNQLVTARINRVTAIYTYLEARTVVDATLGTLTEL
ncbi:MAG: TolC family protein [bacterium]|nr:TolC family protein [bacterium]